MRGSSSLTRNELTVETVCRAAFPWGFGGDLVTFLGSKSHSPGGTAKAAPTQSLVVVTFNVCYRFVARRKFLVAGRDP